MKKIVKWLVIGVGVVLLLPLGGAGVLLLAFPKSRPAAAEVVERTPERLARGTYLMENLLPCQGCHSDPDLTKYGMPIKPGRRYSGGLVIDHSFGFPGVMQPTNITPDPETGIGKWSDGEVMRAIREGIHKDGRPLLGSMPYVAFRHLSEEDLRSIVVYLRSLPPVRNTVRPTQMDFPLNLLSRMAPEPVSGAVSAPDPKDSVAYGGYLVEIAGCKLCHTPFDRGQLKEDEAFSGGREFPIPGPDGKKYRAVTTNITPDPTGYFGRATKEEWIGRVRSFASMRENPVPVAIGRNTLMPWLELSGLSEEDLGAIYDHMKTVKPVRKELDPFPDAPPEPPAPATADTQAAP